MSLVAKQWKFLRNVAKLIAYADSLGWVLTGGELYRTMDQQKIYMRNGQSKTLNSRHLSRLAIDLNLFINGKYVTNTDQYKPLGDFWRTLDERNVWGGDWNNNGSMQDESFLDGNHFEMRP